MAVQPALVAGPLIAAVAIMGGCGWRKEMFNRKQKNVADQEQQRLAAAARLAIDEAIARERVRRDELLRAAATLRPDAERWSRGRGVGQIVYAVVGTAFANQVPGILEEHRRAGTADYVAHILVAEPDEQSRAVFVQSLPEEFRDRIIEVALPLLPAGLLGRTVAEVQDLAAYWRADLDGAIDRWLTQLRLAAKVVALYLFVSPGGSGVLGHHIVSRFAREYDQAQVYVLMVLDHKTDRRELNIPALLALFDTDAVNGLLIGDNQSSALSAEQFDQGLAYLLPAMIAATWIDPKPQSGFNVLPDVFRRHKVATLRVWWGWLPVRYLPPFHTLPAVYYTDGAFSEIQAVRGVDAVQTDASLQALPLTQAERPHFLYVATPVRPDPELKRLAERVRARVGARLTPDVSLAFASLGYPLTPATREVPIVVISLFPVIEGIAGVTQLVSATPSALPVQVGDALPIGRNSHHPAEAGAERRV